MLLSTIDTSTKRRTRKELSKYITSLQYLLNFAPSLGNLKYFRGQKNRAFYSTLINCSTETFSRKSVVEFWFNHCFPGSSLTNYNKTQHCVLPQFTCFRNRALSLFLCFFLADCRMYKGHSQNEWAIKPFQKHAWSTKVVCIKSSPHFMLNLYPSLRNSNLTKPYKTTTATPTGTSKTQ